MTAVAPAMGRATVPYVTAYSGEALPYEVGFAPHAEATDGLRLSFADPVALDWMFGVLWHRQGMSRQGRPLWALVHTARQRRCMLRNLCQVCGTSAVDPESGRVWWVLPDPPGRTGDVLFTHAPPTCLACIPDALDQCPRLRRGADIYTASGGAPWGVVGEVFEPRGGGAVQVDPGVEVPLEAFHRLEYMLATQLIVSVSDLEPALLPRRRYAAHAP